MNAFYGCPYLTSITIPDNVKTVGSWTFAYCLGATTVTIGTGITSIGERAFTTANDSKTKLTTVNIKGGSSATIGDYAFANIPALSSLTIGSGIKTIGEESFSGCYSIKGALTLPSAVTTIGIGTFSDCTGITSVNIQGSVATIPENAFESCASLINVNFSFPSAVTTIDPGAFPTAQNSQTLLLAARLKPSAPWLLHIANPLRA